MMNRDDLLFIVPTSAFSVLEILPMTFSNVEPFVKFGFCCGAVFFTFQLANAVSQSLTGPNQLTVYF
jgi:hypothetical protein